MYMPWNIEIQDNQAAIGAGNIAWSINFTVIYSSVKQVATQPFWLQILQSESILGIHSPNQSPYSSYQNMTAGLAMLYKRQDCSSGNFS